MVFINNLKQNHALLWVEVLISSLSNSNEVDQYLINVQQAGTSVGEI